MDLQKELADETQRMPAVLMGVASAAIAFSFHETSEREVSWHLLPILCAVLSWGGSFAAGVLFSRNRTSVIKVNMAWNEAEALGDLPKLSDAKRKFKTFADRSALAYSAQQWLMLIGACFYLLGHAWHLVDRPKAETAIDASATLPASDWDTL